MLNFSHSGLLVPSSAIPSDIHEMETEFVVKIPTLERKKLFEAYINYSEKLKQLCGNIDLVQWVDGSFVTGKPMPGDIDLISFINFEVVSSLKEALIPFKYPESEVVFNVDAYIVVLYPTDSRYHNYYLSDKAYWAEKFSKTTRNSKGIMLAKEFLEITY